MYFAIGKVFVAATLISLVSWLSGQKTALAGFLTALPLTSMLALAFSHFEWSNTAQSITYAKSIFVAVPVSLLFFVPFLIADKFNLGFWISYILGFLLLVAGYFIHQFLSKLI